MKHILLIQNYRRCDLLQSTPAIAALRRSRPEAHIAVLVRKPAADTLRGNTDVDEIIEWDTDPLVVAPEEDPRKLARAKESLSEFIHKLRARNFDAVYNFSNDLPCALLAYLLNPRKYAGLAYCDDRRYRVRNEWIRYLFLAAELRGMNTLNFADILMEACAASEELAPRIFGGPEDERFAEQTIAAAFGHTARPVAIGIPPPEEARFWPLKRFIEVAAALQLSGAEILLLGPDAQQHTAEQLAGSLPNPARALNLAGKASLHKTAALLKRCKYLVAADSVTPQVAAATYTPSLLTCYGALYAGDIGPYGDGHYILEPASRCFPCASHYQCRTMHCRNQIHTKDILAAIRCMLSTGSIIPKRLRAENLVLSRSTWMPDGLLGLQPLNRPPISIQPLLRMIFRTCSLACRLPLIRPKARSLWRPWRKEIFRWYRLPDRDELAELLRRVKLARRELENLLETAETCADLCVGLMRRPTVKTDGPDASVVAVLDQLERRVLDFEEQDVARFLVAGFRHSLRDSDHLPFNQTLAVRGALCRRLSHACRFTSQALREFSRAALDHAGGDSHTHPLIPEMSHA